MTPFEFVSVFYAVVLGLAVAQLMGALGDLLEVRQRVRGYWVLHLWIVNFLVVQAQAWWGMWDLRETRWHLLEYFLVVVYFSLVYLATTLLLPRVRDVVETIDLRAHFYSVHRAYFGALCAIAVVGGVMNVFLFRSAPLSVFTYVPATFALFSALAAWTTNRRFHAGYAVGFAVVYWYFMFIDIAAL